MFSQESPVIKVTAVDKETTRTSQTRKDLRKGSQQNNKSKEDAEQESEYDMESESEEQVVNLDENEDEMTFLRAVTTHRKRTVKVMSEFF